MKNTDLSVVLISWTSSQPDYRINLLKRTLDSLKRCTEIPYTLVVVDNGGKEQTAFLRTIEPDIHIINKVNVGPGVARNQGGVATDSKYIAFIDNDLRFYSAWLSDSISILDKFRDQKFIVVPTQSGPMKQRLNFLEEAADYELWRMAAGYCMVMPRTAFEEVGRWVSSEVHAIEDREWGNRAFSKGWKFFWPRNGSVRHMGRYKSFDKKKFLVNGVWVTLSHGKVQESTA